jgi:hypothetical protein
MQAIIALKDGRFKKVKAKPTHEPGIVITGTRGGWCLTHVPSGALILNASLWDKRLSVRRLKDAMMDATMVDMILGGPVDWNVTADELDRDRATEWVKSVATFVASGR